MFISVLKLLQPSEPYSNTGLRNVTVVDVHFSLMAILFRLPDVFESTNCTPGFVEPALGVLPFWTMLSVHSHSPDKMFWTVDLCRC